MFSLFSTTIQPLTLQELAFKPCGSLPAQDTLIVWFFNPCSYALHSQAPPPLSAQFPFSLNIQIQNVVSTFAQHFGKGTNNHLSVASQYHMLPKMQIFEVLQNEENLLSQFLTITPFPEAQGLGGECGLPGRDLSA